MICIRAGLALGVTVMVLLGTVPASAAVPSPRVWPALQEPAPTRDEAAIAFAAGETAFARADYAAAAVHFARAQALVPHPFTAYNLGLAQARAGAKLEAWHTFSQLRLETVDPERHTEIEVQLARLSPAVARLQIHATKGQVVRVDGSTVESGVELVRAPGPVRIEVDGQAARVELRGGELRHVELREVVRRSAHAPSRTQTAVLASSVAFGAGTAGTALAAALLRRDRIGPPLAYTAAGLGAATLALAATALHLHLRQGRARRKR